MEALGKLLVMNSMNPWGSNHETVSTCNLVNWKGVACCQDEIAPFVCCQLDQVQARGHGQAVRYIALEIQSFEFKFKL